MSKKSSVITLRLERRDLERVEAVRVLENVDRSTLLKEFIEDGLSWRVVHLYRRGKLTAGRAAEILGISLREFLEMLEREGVPVNWDSRVFKEYLKEKYGESNAAPSNIWREPLIHLAQINKLHLIKRLFNSIFITPEVKREAFDEGIRLGHADAQAAGEAIEEGCIIIEGVSKTTTLAAKKLAKGENISQTDAKTLLLARASRAEILVDEKALSDLAKMYGLKVWNTWTILLESLRRGLIEISDIESAITELGEKRHKLKNKQASEILKAAKIIASHRKRNTRSITNHNPLRVQRKIRNKRRRRAASRIHRRRSNLQGNPKT